MAPSPAYHYIPVGSVSILRDQSSLEADYWGSDHLRQWVWLSRATDIHHPGAPAYTLPTIPDEAQRQLLGSPELSHFRRLFQYKWANLQFRIHSANHSTLRVYLLPDDVAHRSIDRTDVGLQRAKQAILDSIDYSASGWNGQPPDMSTGPIPYQTTDMDTNTQEMTLLQLFNRLNSPSPDPNIVSNVAAQNGMYYLLESRIDGLKTDLYPHQRRSSALMLQKESQPGQTLDPRLQHVRDQNGEGWYVDLATGSILTEPRYYDGISGGILAEEMGSGKTLICLALILATKQVPARAPEIYGAGHAPTRPRIASLAEMAASCANRNSVAWKTYFDSYASEYGYEFPECVNALRRNPGYYFVPAPETRRCARHRSQYPLIATKKVFLSATSLVIVPNNLVNQWREEISKHTDGLNTLILTKHTAIPPSEDIIKYDMLLFAQGRFEMIAKEPGGMAGSPLSKVHFKRCIVDEGHKLGNSKISARSVLLTNLDELQCTSRWIVTGTPSHGLFGQENGTLGTASQVTSNGNESEGGHDSDPPSNELESQDLRRIGSITALYLKARPWANTGTEQGDTVADWKTYLMLPKHNSGSRGRWDCLSTTLNSLIIRHKVAEIGELLPSVKEDVIYLEGSYQDQLSTNLFSMMIIFNAVQSQRTDQDYFFHSKQRSSLLEIVHNLKQASFFGGSFFSAQEIEKAVHTAEEFLKEKKVECSLEDQQLLQEAINLGHLASRNVLRNLSNLYHEMPVCVQDLPADSGSSWCLGEGSDGRGACTSASLLLSLQSIVYNSLRDPAKFNALLNGGLALEGTLEKKKLLDSQTPAEEAPSEGRRSPTLAGNTKIGHDNARKHHKHVVNRLKPIDELESNTFSHILDPARITATVSAKLSYLLDNIIRYQDEEKIIVFYENQNTAWYLASMLDVVQVQYLIYAKTLSVERRAQYIKTFNHNSKFRVLLMDLSQAAFGLDMRDASRIYFINPVLNPQVEAQAIGRVRRISQNKPVSVETLVLRNSLDEVILERKLQMTQAEHRQTKTILDIPSIYNWIKNAKITPLPECTENQVSQMSNLVLSHHVFGRGFGRVAHPDEDLAPSSPVRLSTSDLAHSNLDPNGQKRPYEAGPGKFMRQERIVSSENRLELELELPARPTRRVKFSVD
ncbi:unnamed protein product [Clonostachys chloroleuca]|uniref:Helicase C-terminal domain-containing protein n=1 Tax=Clonostachys chloroleuca TaxID=1926264 RepID=A0AA35MER7_9HYPO|nr:unnamed protein product [Clonostachys chloroleuca]